MAQYINKEELLARLKDRISEGEYLLSMVPCSSIAGVVHGFKRVVELINELEVKED